MGCGAVQECARYLETFKAYEHKSPDLLKGPVYTDYASRVSDILTSIKSKTEEREDLGDLDF